MFSPRELISSQEPWTPDHGIDETFNIYQGHYIMLIIVYGCFRNNFCLTIKILVISVSCLMFTLTLGSLVLLFSKNVVEVIFLLYIFYFFMYFIVFGWLRLLKGIYSSIKSRKYTKIWAWANIKYFFSAECASGWLDD